MKKLITFITLFSLILGIFTFAPNAEARSYRTKASDVRVNGYYRKNGSYVQPYYRSKADSYKFNNYSCLDYGRCR